MEEEKLLDYPYPDKLLDEDGYPTTEALLYIRNWGTETVDGDYRFGKWFTTPEMHPLIDYIKSIYTYDDAIREQDGLLEIHTFGWSGNEEIIYELKKTSLWMFKFVAQQTGGHYYFCLDSDSEYTWSVEKVKRYEQ
jgi:hypothetical protein